MHIKYFTNDELKRVPLQFDVKTGKKIKNHYLLSLLGLWLNFYFGNKFICIIFFYILRMNDILMIFVFVWLLYLVWSFLGSSMLLQMILFHSFLWLSNFHLYIHKCTSLYRYLYKYTSFIHTHTYIYTLNLFFFFFFRVTPVAYGSFQARGWIRATAAGLCHSHSNPGSDLWLWPTPQLMATPDP